MAAQETDRVALMAVQPRFAQAILAGTKTIEFRKRVLASDVRTVLIYETAPTQAIVGEFELREHVVAAPSNLWHRFAAVGGIDVESYNAYFAGRPEAVGLRIASVQAYTRGVSLNELTPPPAIPQSFAYLLGDQLEQARSRALAAPRASCLVVLI